MRIFAKSSIDHELEFLKEKIEIIEKEIERKKSQKEKKNMVIEGRKHLDALEKELASL